MRIRKDIVLILHLLQTLMFRAMGIPARYVEGYAVRPSDLIQTPPQPPPPPPPPQYNQQEGRGPYE